MSSFEIIGAKKLKGEITPQGAKNEALQVICAVLLSPETVTISNIPNIRDVNKLIELMQDLGVKVEKKKEGEYSFCADEVNLDFMYTDDYKQKATSLRGSIMIIGPLLSRFGQGLYSKARRG